MPRIVKKGTTSILFLLTFFQVVAFAQSQSFADTVNIDEVVITGSKTSVNRNIVPLTVSVVSGEMIKNSSESSLLPVLSAQVPGLFVTERGITGFGVATGSAGQITIRGVGGSVNNQVLVLVDGNPQFMGIMGHPLPDAYVASDAEKVEVIRGAASTLYGTNAMGGVINIITKEQKEEGLSATGRIMYGSYDTRKYMIGAGFRKKNLNLYASFNHDETDGHRDSSDFRINNAYAKAGYDINKNLSLNANMSFAGFNATDPGYEDANAGNSYDIIRGMIAASISNKFQTTEGSIRFFYNFGDHSISDGYASTDINKGIIAYQSVNLFKGNTVTFGTDIKRYGGIAENIISEIEIVDTTINEMAGYVFIEQEIYKGKININGGFRLEHNNVFGYQPVPSLGMSYNPSLSTTVKASVSKGFRSPTIRELFMWGPANVALKPETMMNYEAGVLQRLFGNKLSCELTLFNINGENLIQTLMTNEGPRNLNTGSFSNTGVEFAGTFIPVKDLTLNATYSYLSMKQPVTAAPRQHLNLSGSYKLKMFTFNVSLQHVNDLYTQIKPTIIKESYTLMNSRISFNPVRHVNIFVKGENLINEKYNVNYGYPMPGIVVFCGMNLNI